MVNFFVVFIILFIVSIAFKIYWKLTTKWNNSYTCLINKTVIVTGANSGIGYITALDFAKRGARVILACRNEERAKEAQGKIIKATGNENVAYKLIDMASFQSVRDFATEFNQSEERLDILVNNAGVMFTDINYTVDGIESVIHVNYLSPFLLTHLLIDKLKNSTPSRIVNVASSLACFSRLNLKKVDNIHKVPSITVWRAAQNINSYFTTKQCNILFTTELAHKLEGTDVTVNALHPGVIYTNLVRYLPGFIITMWNLIGWILLLTAEEGAQTQIYLSVSEDVKGISGGLFSNCTEIGLYKVARHPNLAKKVWAKSAELCKLNPNERI